MQKWVKENTRLGIPILFHDELLPSWPMSLRKEPLIRKPFALASTWDPPLVGDVFLLPPAAEVPAARGVQNTALRPFLIWRVIPVGAATERKLMAKILISFTRIGVAAIQGLQGTGPAIDKSHVMATAKHFAVHGQPEGGTNVAPREFFPNASSANIS